MWLEMWAKFQVIGSAIGLVVLAIVFLYACYLSLKR